MMLSNIKSREIVRLTIYCSEWHQCVFYICQIMYRLNLIGVIALSRFSIFQTTFALFALKYKYRV